MLAQQSCRGGKKATRCIEHQSARRYHQLPLDLQLELILWLLIHSICNQNTPLLHTIKNYIPYLETGNIPVIYMNKYRQIYVTPG
jgi:hypothetical protein